MATTTLTRIYATYDQAASIVAQLEAAHISAKDITLLSHDPAHAGLSSYEASKDYINRTETFDTAVTTGGLGAGVGLLTGLGLIAIPGLGPIAAVGWLGATLIGFTFGAAGGAAVAGIAESLSKHGVDHETAIRNAKQLESGGTLVAVRCDAGDLGTVESIMGTSDQVLESGDTSTTASRVA